MSAPHDPPETPGSQEVRRQRLVAIESPHVAARSACVTSAGMTLQGSTAQIASCFEAFSVLRPHLRPDQFLSQVRRQEAQGYRVLALQHEGRIKSAAGFRLSEFLAWGKFLYIDDLTTLPEARGGGFATRLLDWLTERAAAHGCDAVHRDTGYTRHAAHRVDLRNGCELACRHLSKSLR